MAWDAAAFKRFYNMTGEPWGHPGARPAVRLHYNWWSITRFQKAYAGRVATVLGLNAGDEIVLVGAGLNATGQGLTDLGYPTVACEISDYILGTKDDTDEAEVRAFMAEAGVNPDTEIIDQPAAQNWGVEPGSNYLDVYLQGGRAAPKPRGFGVIMAEDLSSNNSRNKVRQALSSDPRYLITEEVLNSISDAEALTLCDRLSSAASQTGSTVVHLLSPRQPSLPLATETSSAGLIYGQWHTLNWKTYAAWRAFLDTNGFSDHKVAPTVTARDQGMTMGINPKSNVFADLGQVFAWSGVF